MKHVYVEFEKMLSDGNYGRERAVIQSSPTRRRMPSKAAWHIHFDGQSEIALHVCELHRAIGGSLPCPDARPDGDCAHVQTRPCTCEPVVECDGCVLPNIAEIDARWTAPW